MNQISSDTIAAIATPIGVGGISVIRISGTDAINSVEHLFVGSVKITKAQSHTIHYGSVKNQDGTTIDMVLVSLFRSPHSYTGEDVCEISCHGGYYISERILAELFQLGIRPALPGEFTLRAFLNGKLDLAQAEAVSDMIQSKTEKSLKTSLDQLNGKLSRYIESLRQEVLDVCSLFELELDFSQEGIEIVDKGLALTKIITIQEKIQTIISTYSSGKHIREGVSVVLVGKPNAGKSSLMNRLLEEERAIVSPTPGTTRDTIEETIALDGIEFVFTDTAGLRTSTDIIEEEGIKRASKKIVSADIVCILIDSSENISEDDILLYQKVEGMMPQPANALYVFNKIDIMLPTFFKVISKIQKKTISISCKTGAGLTELKKGLSNIALPNYDSTESSVIVSNARHKFAFENALEGIVNAVSTLKQGMGDEFVAVDLKRAADFLGEIIGVTTADDILNNIFSKFCIGK
jgi:tRNA modification GTPase